MATSEMADVIKTLLTAPVAAATQAELEYRQIWKDWLRDILALVAARKGTPGFDEKKALSEHLDLAPVMNLGAQVELGITMRVASIKKSEGELSLGLNVAPLQVSGSYGFMSQHSSESVLTARAQYALANTQSVSLKDYLGQYSIPVNTAENVEKAITFLGTKAPSASPEDPGAGVV